MRFLYTLLLRLSAPFWLIHTARSAYRRGTSGPRWKERFGYLPFKPDPERKRIWIHAVSVGEVMVVAPVIRALKQRLPGYEVIVSTTTTTGQATAQQSLQGIADYIVFMPFDLPGACRRAFQRATPQVVVIAETELWLNFLAEAKRAKASTLIINGRISDRSFNRARKFSFFYKILLRYVDTFLMQSEVDAERIKTLGADPLRVTVSGNTKFDQAVDTLDADPVQLRKDLHLPSSAPVIVVGSTRAAKDGEPVEEELVLDAFDKIRQAIPEVCLILAPRHLERTDVVERLMQEHGLDVIRRTKLTETHGEARYIVLDTFGELAKIYAIASVAVVGGGFAPLGGQNIFQPLAHGVPTFFGPHMHNFRDIAALANTAGIGFNVTNSDELANGILSILNDPARRKQINQDARVLISKNKGVSQRCAEVIASFCQH
ncbi:MAG: 3-deoxy-D-manno-octulosonic acid transferase [bacterium]